MCVIIVVFKHLLRHINQSRLSVVSIWSVIYCASSFINYLSCGTYVCMYAKLRLWASMQIHEQSKVIWVHESDKECQSGYADLKV